MAGFTEGLELGSLPFQGAYEEVAASFDNAQRLAHYGQYGDPHSGVVRQILRPDSRFRPGGQFFNQFANLLTGQQPTEEVVFDLGIEIGASIQESYQTPRNLILGYLNTEVQTLLLRAGLAGRDPRARDIAHEVDNAKRIVVAEAIPLDTKTDHIFRALAESLVVARAVDTQNEALFTLLSMRLEDLWLTYHQSRDIYSYAADHFGSRERLPEEEQQTADKGINLLTQTAMQQRKYGTKPAYIESSLGGAWVFYDGNDYLDNVVAASNNTAFARLLPPAAMVFHVRERDLNGIDISIDALPIDETGRVRRTGAGLMVADIEFNLVIHQNGSITVDLQGLQPVQAMMARDPDSARRLLAEVAANFYDLSMPIVTDAAPAPRNYTQMEAGEREHFDPISQLLIPRLRRLQAPTETASETPRVIREHDVTWYVRPIPLGWHASPDAVAKAAKVGVVLGPHETFVKAHKRGQDESRIVGYHAIRRTTSLAPADEY